MACSRGIAFANAILKIWICNVNSQLSPFQNSLVQEVGSVSIGIGLVIALTLFAENGEVENRRVGHTDDAVHLSQQRTGPLRLQFRMMNTKMAGMSQAELQCR